MTDRKTSVAALVELLARKAPEYLDLMTAETDADFERAFDALLEKAVRWLETNSVRFASLDEDGLSGVIAAALSVPGLTVQREAHSNGHVDLTIEATYCFPMRLKLGEAKIYDGPERHIGGLGQLLTRYSTGREGRGVLIEYVRKQDIESLVIKIRERMDAELPLKQISATRDHPLKWSFLSNHTHASGGSLEVGHIGCNLFVNSNVSTNPEAS
jgi:hypothetical protein